MHKKLFIVFLLAFIGQLFSAYAYCTPTHTHVPTDAKEITFQTKFLQHSSSELDLVHCQVNTGVRVISVQKDSSSEVQLAARANCSALFLSTSFLYTSTSFSKNYIDHIYPSHHFW